MAKNNMMKKIFILAVLLLGMALSLPCGASAESNQAHKLTPKEKQLMAQAPRTPEELLQRLDKFLKNPDVDGLEFLRTITGFDCWNYVSTIRYYCDDPKKVVLNYLCSGPFSRRLHAHIDKNSSRIEFVGLCFANDFHLTPAMVRSVFGVPDNVYVTNPLDEFSAGKSYVNYQYNTGKYRMNVYTGDLLPYVKDKEGIDVAIKNRNVKIIGELRRYFKQFKHHANIRITCIELRKSCK